MKKQRIYHLILKKKNVNQVKKYNNKTVNSLKLITVIAKHLLNINTD